MNCKHFSFQYKLRTKHIASKVNTAAVGKNAVSCSLRRTGSITIPLECSSTETSLWSGILNHNFRSVYCCATFRSVNSSLTQLHVKYITDLMIDPTEISNENGME